jgi:hypothetical protein
LRGRMNSDAQASTPELPMLNLPPSPQFYRWSQALFRAERHKFVFLHAPSHESIRAKEE